MNPQTPTLKEQLEQYVKQLKKEIADYDFDINATKQNLEYAIGKRSSLQQNLSRLECFLSN